MKCKFSHWIKTRYDSVTNTNVHYSQNYYVSELKIHRIIVYDNFKGFIILDVINTFVKGK